MVSKKDVLDVALWSSISTVIGVTIASVMPLSCEDYNYRRVAVGRSFVDVLTGTLTGGIIGGQHLISMKHKYDNQELDILRTAVMLSTGAICGVIAVYGVLPVISSPDYTDYGSTPQNDLEKRIGIAMEWINVGMPLVGIAFAMGGFWCEQGERMFKTREEKAAIKLKEVLLYDESRDKDIFKTLERYNKVYKKMFTKLGTPYEMAKMTNNREAEKQIINKNNELILQSLLCYNNQKVKAINATNVTLGEHSNLRVSDNATINTFSLG